MTHHSAGVFSKAWEREAFAALVVHPYAEQIAAWYHTAARRINHDRVGPYQMYLYRLGWALHAEARRVKRRGRA